MRNRYPGTCYVCGLPVEAGTGHFERMRGIGWRTKHALHKGNRAVTCEMARRAHEHPQPQQEEGRSNG